MSAGELAFRPFPGFPKHGVRVNHAFCIHDFFQPEDAGIPKIGENVPAVKAGFLLFRGCAKGEKGEHKEYIGRAFLTL